MSIPSRGSGVVSLGVRLPLHGATGTRVVEPSPEAGKRQLLAFALYAGSVVAFAKVLSRLKFPTSRKQPRWISELHVGSGPTSPDSPTSPMDWNISGFLSIN